LVSPGTRVSPETTTPYAFPTENVVYAVCSGNTERVTVAPLDSVAEKVELVK